MALSTECRPLTAWLRTPDHLGPYLALDRFASRYESAGGAPRGRTMGDAATIRDFDREPGEIRRDQKPPSFPYGDEQ